jgi:hypothetical protein
MTRQAPLSYTASVFEDGYTLSYTFRISASNYCSPVDVHTMLIMFMILSVKAVQVAFCI